MVQPRKRPVKKAKPVEKKTPKRGIKPTIEQHALHDILGDEVKLSISCDIKSSVDFVSVGTSASLTTTVPKEKLAEAEIRMQSYLRQRCLEEHSRLDIARNDGLAP